MNGTVHARVLNGRLQVDEATDLPEGTEVELLPIGAGDTLTEDERAQRDAAIDRGLADLAAGRMHSHEDVVRALRGERAR